MITSAVMRARIFWMPLLIWTCLACPGAAESTGHLLFRETFDTPAMSNRDIHDARFAAHRMQTGRLVLQYNTLTTAAPHGIECTLPVSGTDPAERVIEMDFGGGATEGSNSLLISYALAPGNGLCLPPFGYGGESDQRTGSRSGYIIRYVRHGDGTNEIRFYRNDGGWIKLLKNDWTLPANPITTLRKTAIRHRKNGEHEVTSVFDTGTPFQKTWTFEDDAYPPGNLGRGIQVTAKAHAGFDAAIEFRLDTWTVTDLGPDESPMALRQKRPLNQKTRPRDPDKKLDPTLEVSNAAKLHAKGDHKSARDICLTVLEQDSQYADAMDLLGRVESSLENYSDAHRLLTEALEIRRRVHGAIHVKVAESLTHLGALYAVRDPAESERFYREAVAVKEKTLGPSDPSVAESFQGLAAFCAQRGRMTEAETFYKKALVIREKSLRPDHPDLLSSLNDMAMFYRNQDRPTDAIPFFKRLLLVQEKPPVMDSAALASTLLHLGLLQHYLGRLPEAGRMFQRSLEINEKMVGPAHPDVAKIIYNLGVVHQMQSKYPEAERYFKRALAIEEKALGPDHHLVATELHHLGMVYQRTGRNDEAEAAYRRALSILEKQVGPGHRNILVLSEKLSALYKKMGRPMESEFYADRARKIRNKL